MAENKKGDPLKDIADQFDTSSKDLGGLEGVGKDSAQKDLDDFFAGLQEPTANTSPNPRTRFEANKRGGPRKTKKFSLAFLFTPLVKVFSLISGLLKRIPWKIAAPAAVVLALAVIGYNWLSPGNNLFSWEKILSYLPSFGRQKVLEIPEGLPKPKVQNVIPVPPGSNWYIQVASCIDPTCQQSVDQKLQRGDVAPEMVSSINDKMSSVFLKLYLTNVYSYMQDARADMQKINLNNAFGLQSYIERQDLYYRIVIGFFPQETYGIEDVIAKVQRNLQEIIPSAVLEESYQRKWGEVVKYYIGPFASRTSTQQFLDQLQTRTGFEESFILQR